MKTILLFVILFCFTTTVFSQETVKRTNRLTSSVIEKFEVLKSDKKIRHGGYQAIRGDVTLAMGLYKDGKRAGHWTFNDYKGDAIQTYNYTRNQLEYNDPKDANWLKYEFTDSLKAGDTVHYPVKIGGYSFGVSTMVLADQGLGRVLFENYKGYDSYKCLHIFTVTPEGKMEKHEVIVTIGNEKKSYTVNDEGFTDEYKQFVPATINGRPVECKVAMESMLGMSTFMRVRSF